MDALILAAGDAPSRAGLDRTWPGWDAGVGLVIAADGGARHAPGLGVRIDLWVGDGDSISAEDLLALAASGVPLERTRTDKDESDTELAVLAAARRGAQGIVVVGALGGDRIDHALANIGLLALPVLAGRRASIIDDHQRLSLIRAPGPDGEPVTRAIPGRIGDVVSLLPWSGTVTGVTTGGLAYALVDEPLPAGPARGLSNVRTHEDASVRVRDGLLLVIESPATL